MQARLLRRIAAPFILSLLAACGTQSTGLGIDLVSQDRVIEMAKPAWEEILREAAPSSNTAYRQTAREVADRLLTAAGENPAGWDVRVFQGDQANAFALPNAKIGVYEGMFKVAANEAQLAAVVGHEIAHVRQEHATERVNSQMATQLGVQIAGSVVGSTTGVSPQTLSGLLGAGAQYGIIMPYGRNQELEADRLGLSLMARAGYDPRAAVELWRNMRQSGGGQPPVFMSTHPGHDQRIAQLEQLMPQALAEYRQR